MMTMMTMITLPPTNCPLVLADLASRHRGGGGGGGGGEGGAVKTRLSWRCSAKWRYCASCTVRRIINATRKMTREGVMNWWSLVCLCISLQIDSSWWISEVVIERGHYATVFSSRQPRSVSNFLGKGLMGSKETNCTTMLYDACRSQIPIFSKFHQGSNLSIKIPEIRKILE